MGDFLEWIRDNGWQSWLVLAAVLGGLEMVGLDLWLVMLAGGALAGAVVAAFGAPFLLQLGLAIVTALALMGLVRPNVVRRIHRTPTLRIGHHNLIGQRATVLTELGGETPGRIKVAGQEWTSRPYDEDDRIEVGAKVDVVEIKGATAYVLRVYTPELGLDPDSDRGEG